MTRWPLAMLPVLLLCTGCEAFDWVESRVSRYLPQDPVQAPTMEASATPAAQTGQDEHANRNEEPVPTLQAEVPPVEVEDWPELVDCGMG